MAIRLRRFNSDPMMICDPMIREFGQSVTNASALVKKDNKYHWLKIKMDKTKALEYLENSKDYEDPKVFDDLKQCYDYLKDKYSKLGYGEQTLSKMEKELGLDSDTTTETNRKSKYTPDSKDIERVRSCGSLKAAMSMIAKIKDHDKYMRRYIAFINNSNYPMTKLVNSEVNKTSDDLRYLYDLIIESDRVTPEDYLYRLGKYASPDNVIKLAKKYPNKVDQLVSDTNKESKLDLIELYPEKCISLLSRFDDNDEDPEVIDKLLSKLFDKNLGPIKMKSNKSSDFRIDYPLSINDSGLDWDGVLSGTIKDKMKGIRQPDKLFKLAIELLLSEGWDKSRSTIENLIKQGKIDRKKFYSKIKYLIEDIQKYNNAHAKREERVARSANAKPEDFDNFAKKIKDTAGDGSPRAYMYGKKSRDSYPGTDKGYFIIFEEGAPSDAKGITRRMYVDDNLGLFKSYDEAKEKYEDSKLYRYVKSGGKYDNKYGIQADILPISQLENNLWGSDLLYTKAYKLDSIPG